MRKENIEKTYNKCISNFDNLDAKHANEYLARRFGADKVSEHQGRLIAIFTLNMKRTRDFQYVPHTQISAIQRRMPLYAFSCDLDMVEPRKEYLEWDGKIMASDIMETLEHLHKDGTGYKTSYSKKLGLEYPWFHQFYKQKSINLCTLLGIANLEGISFHELVERVIDCKRSKEA